LDGKAKEGGCAICQRINQPRVINLLINPGVDREYGSITCKASREVTPNDKPGIVKEHGR